MSFRMVHCGVVPSHSSPIAIRYLVMATSTVSNVRIAGIASAVPSCICDNAAAAVRFGTEETTKICDAIGVHSRRVAPPELCSSDLCFAAADRLLDELGWERETIAGLIFVSQTPDYRLPATSCVLHARLQLSPACAAFDISMGCSWIRLRTLGRKPNRCILGW